MPKIKYEEWKPSKESLAVVLKANEIIELYQRQGFDLTLRQLYYQFVSRDIIPNKQSEYDRLGSLISRARRAGLVDWSAIVDRTRNLRSLPSWDTPGDIISAVSRQFRLDHWQDQDNYVEVWFEKDALMGVFESAANPLRVPFFSCRGYTSDSEIWSAAQRLRSKRGQQPIILHFGDHDPSGIDMTRDIQDRLRLFGAKNIEVRRLALNMNQIRQYDPPPNPAKETDSRFSGYQAEYGDESWELDALEPTVLAKLVKDEVRELVDIEAWDKVRDDEALRRAELRAVRDKWDEVVETHCGDAAEDKFLDDDTALDRDEDEDEEEDDEEEEG